MQRILAIVAIMLVGSTGKAHDLVRIKLYLGWYVVGGVDADGRIRSRIYGEYVYPDDSRQEQRNAITYVCSREFRPYLIFDLPGIISHGIAVTKHDKEYGFTDNIEAISNDGTVTKWVAWFNGKQGSVVVEFDDSSDAAIHNHFQLLQQVSSSFSLKLPFDGLDPIRYRYASEMETEQKVQRIETGLAKKFELQDKLQFLGRCLDFYVNRPTSDK